MPDRNEDHGGTMQHTDIPYMYLFISQLNEMIIHSTFQVNSSSCSFVWLLGFAATFVTLTLRKEIKFSFGVCCPPDGCWCQTGRAGGGHSSSCKSFTTITVKKLSQKAHPALWGEGDSRADNPGKDGTR